MRYPLKLWLRFMRNSTLMSWKVYLIFLVIELLIYFSQGLNGRELNLVTVVLIPFGNALFFLVIFALVGLSYVSQVHSYLRFFEEQGFCPAYRDAFEEKHIRGKTPNHYQRLIYAEIHLRMGDTERAEFLLGQMKIPESEVTNRALYLVLYMHLALFRGEDALIRDIWNKNRMFLDKLFYDNRQKLHISMLRVCQVSMEAVCGNYDEALSLISRYYSGKTGMRTVELDFLSLQVYIYHKLGESENEARSVEYMKNVIENTKFEYPYARQSAYDSLSRAQNGELPV